MTAERAIKILERRTTIPDDESSYEDINKAIDMAITAICTQQASNPLTFSELLEMDGEPVWWWNTTQDPVCTICIAKKYMEEPTFVTYDFAVEDMPKLVKLSRMKKWGYKPYRCKPSE